MLYRAKSILKIKLKGGDPNYRMEVPILYGPLVDDIQRAQNLVDYLNADQNPKQETRLQAVKYD